MHLSQDSRLGRLLGASVQAPAAHHQAPDRLGEGLVVAGWSPDSSVVEAVEVADNPQLRDRGFVEAFVHPLTGPHEVIGVPFRFRSRTDGWIRSASPTLGQHTEQVLTEVLGYSAEQVAQLRAALVIGEVPLGL